MNQMTDVVAEFPFVSEVTKAKAKPAAWDVLQAMREAGRRGNVLVPVGLAKNLLGVGRQRVYDLIELGTLRTEKIHGHVFVTEESLLEFAKSERRNGRPPKAKTVKDAVKATLEWAREIK